MAEFSASSIVSGNTADLAELIRILESELPAAVSTEHLGSNSFIVNSGTATTLNSLTVNGVETDELLVITGSADYVGDNSGDIIDFQIALGGTSQITRRIEIISGVNVSVCLPLTLQNQSGNLTITWQALRASGSGSTTVARPNLRIVRHKKRA